MTDGLFALVSLLAALFALLALIKCLTDEEAPWHSKLVYSILIVAFPIIGALMYFRNRDEMDEMIHRDGRRPRRRSRR